MLLREGHIPLLHSPPHCSLMAVWLPFTYLDPPPPSPFKIAGSAPGKDGLLGHKKIYQPIQLDPTTKINQQINTFIDTIHNRGGISTPMRYTPKNPEPSNAIYFLKKINKNVHAVQQIVSEWSGPLVFLDYYLLASGPENTTLHQGI